MKTSKIPQKPTEEQLRLLHEPDWSNDEMTDALIRAGDNHLLQFKDTVVRTLTEGPDYLHGLAADVLVAQWCLREHVSDAVRVALKCPYAISRAEALDALGIFVVKTRLEREEILTILARVVLEEQDTHVASFAYQGFIRVVAPDRLLSVHLKDSSEMSADDYRAQHVDHNLLERYLSH